VSTQQAGNKPWWKTFLTPGWVIAAILIVAFSYFAFTFLAPWQLGKNERLEHRNEQIVEAFEQDPVPLSQVLGPDGSFDPEQEWTRVTATGRFASDEVLLRLRPVDRTPAFQVLAPFELETGQTILVNRGWVPAEDSTRVPAFDAPPTGDVTITGMMRVDEGTHPTTPNHDQGYQMVYSISPGQVGELIGTDLASPYIQLLSDSPGVLTAIPLPQLETGNHLSYGLQWILFGILAPAGLIYFIIAETRERRRFRQEQEELLLDDASVDGAGPNPDSGSVEEQEGVDKQTAPAAAPSAPAPARARYGETRRNPWASAYDRQRDRTR